MKRQRALNALNCQYSDRIPHWEAFYSPTYIETYLGIDPYQDSRRGALELVRTHPIDVAVVPYSNTPVPRPSSETDVMIRDEKGNELPRWNTGATGQWDWGKSFASIDDVLAYDPLSEMDCTGGSNVMCNGDYSLPAAELAKGFQAGIDQQRNMFGDTALELAGFYNTLFMWPMLTFGWENLLLLCGGYPAEMKRLLAGFAERSRKVFQAIALTDTPLVWSHDDICCTRGCTVSPQWLREFIYPYYEEFWDIVKKSGKKVLFMCDGNVTAVADDIFTLGADGIMAEPYTNWKELARNHPDKVLIGEGDSRVLAHGDREAIRAMVRSMVATARGCPGYFMSIGNQITHDLAPETIRIYFEAAEEYGRRLPRTTSSTANGTGG